MCVLYAATPPPHPHVLFYREACIQFNTAVTTNLWDLQKTSTQNLFQPLHIYSSVQECAWFTFLHKNVQECELASEFKQVSAASQDTGIGPGLASLSSEMPSEDISKHLMPEGHEALVTQTHPNTIRMMLPFHYRCPRVNRPPARLLCC